MPFGKLNKDYAHNLIPSGDYQAARNLRVLVGEEGGQGGIKNFAGTSQVVNGSIKNPAESWTCIGRFEDVTYNRIFFFLRAASSADLICVYRSDQQDILEVISNEDLVRDGVNKGLNFPQGYITGITMIGTQLFWVDGTNQVRGFDVERMLKRKISSYVSPDGTTPDPYPSGDMEENVISVIKRPPNFPLSITKALSTSSGTIPDQDNNFLDGFSFQFAFRYIYKDNQVSVPSMFSQLEKHNNPDDGNDYDTLLVQVNTNETIPEEVRSIQFMVRNGNTGSFTVIKEMTRDDFESEFDDHNDMTTPLSFYFFNDSVGTGVSDEDAFLPFHNVPITSESIEAAKNRLIVGNNTMGYDPLTDAPMTMSIVSQTTGGSSITGEYIFVQIDCFNPDDEFEAVEFTRILVKVNEGDPAIDGIYNTSVSDNGFGSGMLPPSVTVGSSDRLLTNPSATDQEIIDSLYTCDPSWTDNSSVNSSYTGTDPTVLGIGGATSVGEGFTQFKTNSRFRGGIIFYDQWGRHNGVYSNDDCLVQTEERSFSQSTYYTTIGWDLSSLNPTHIPQWATHYSIVLTKNLSYLSFIQHYSTEIKYVTRDADGTLSYSDTSTSNDYAIAYDLSKLTDDKLGYTFQEGDVLRSYNAGGDSYKLNVIGTQGKYVLVEPTDMGNLAGITHLIEIASPYRGRVNELFYETGNMYKVNLPGSPNRALETTSGTLMGDTTVKVRDYGAGNVLVEAMNPDDDYWTVWDVNAGRASIQPINAKQEVRKTGIAYSGTYIQGSSVNSINVWKTADQRTLDSVIGPIRKMVLTNKTQEYGSVLLVVGENETVSVYLDETRFTDTEGNNIISSSGDFIGTINPLRGSYGTKHPESVASYKGKVYFWDQYNGTVVRYNLNGLSPVSDNGLKNLFERIRERIKNTSFGILGEIDPTTEEYLIGIPSYSVESSIENLVDFEETILAATIAETTPGHDLSIDTEAGCTYKIRVQPTQASIVRMYFGEVEVLDVVTSDHEFEVTATSVSDITVDLLVPTTITIVKYKKSPHEMFGESGFLAYHDDIGWTTQYGWSTEMIGRVNNVLVSWNDAEMYLHNSSIRNTVYGLTYKTGYGVVLNEFGDTPMLIRHLTVEGTHPPSWTHIRIEGDGFVQSTDLVRDDWVYKNGVWMAYVMRDRLTPNSASVLDALNKGFLVIGPRPQIYFEWDNTDYIEVRGVKVFAELAYGHASKK